MTKRVTARMLLLVGAFAASFQLVAAAPASLVLAFGSIGAAGVAADSATGTLWNGTLHGAAADGVALGDVAFALDAVALAAGRLKADVALSGGSLTGAGVVATSGGRLVLKDAAFAFDLSAATRYAFLGAPLTGTLRAEVKELIIGKNGCERVEAVLWSDVLAGPAKRFAGEGLDLAGAARCEGDDFAATLAGDGAEGAVRMNVAVAPSMTYTLTASAQPVRREVAQALQAFGFREENGALTIAMSGVVKAAGL